ncbi:MAG: hypothetical protein VB072_16315 [Lentimicrobium sp.]|jgi:peptidyl-tRNA hydrolase|nr:hypothetical protein [Lentimicrobium sp.]MEA5111994.1 hypothetical protein [Lentimicrobium sp.]
MTRKELKMKAAAVAVGCYLKQQQQEHVQVCVNEWARMGLKMAMNGREILQLKGRMSRMK